MLKNYRTPLEKDLQSAILRYKDKLGLEILKKRDRVSVVWSSRSLHSNKVTEKREELTVLRTATLGQNLSYKAGGMGIKIRLRTILNFRHTVFMKKIYSIKQKIHHVVSKSNN